MSRWLRTTAVGSAIALGIACDPKPEPQAPTAAPTTPTSPVAAAATAPAPTASAVGPAVDLQALGLPLLVDAPACAKASRPMVVIPDNASSAILACEVSEAEAFSGKAAFAIQISLAKGMIGQSEIAQDLNFVRFTSTKPGALEWETNLFGETRREFQLRAEIAGTAYACYPQFGSADVPTYEQMLAACRSLRAR